jgi:NitT/TauT family transport system substrate-binding protein
MYPQQVYRVPVLLADQQGIFEDHGIEISIVPQPANLTATQGLAATGSDVGLITPATLGQGVQAGDDAVMFCGSQNILAVGFLAAADSELPTVPEGASAEEVITAFSGLKVGTQTPIGSGLQLMVASVLEGNGATDLTWINSGVQAPVVSAALDNGDVDVAQMSSPTFEQMVIDGIANEVIWMPDHPDIWSIYGSAFTGPRNWVEENAELTTEFCTAIDEANAWMIEHPDESKALLVEDSGSTPEAADAVWERIDTYVTEIDQEQLDATYDLLREVGVLQPEPEVTFESTVIPRW